ncbi:hypothetical protein ACLKA6_019990 [Drosophila palustris]
MALAIRSLKCGRAWGDGTRDLTGINYDTGSRTNVQHWDTDSPLGKRICPYPDGDFNWGGEYCPVSTMSRQVRAPVKFN